MRMKHVEQMQTVLLCIDLLLQIKCELKAVGELDLAGIPKAEKWIRHKTVIIILNLLDAYNSGDLKSTPGEEKLHGSSLRIGFTGFRQRRS